MIKKAFRKARFFTNDALFALGWRRAASLLTGPGQCILVYHGIDQRGDTSLNGRFISASRLNEQLRFLREHAQVVSLDDYFAQQFDSQGFTVALTFDDGYRNNLRYALPLLEQHQLPATFFLTSAPTNGARWLWMDFLDVATRLGPDRLEVNGRPFFKKRWRHTRFYADADGRKLVDWARYSPWAFVQALETAFQEAGAWARASDWADYWALLSPPEIKQLAASPYARVGAHGHTHQDLAVLPHEVACRELETCKTALEHLVGQPVRALAYPFGAYTRPLLDFAAQIGFEQQLAVDFLFAEDYHDPRLRARFGVNPFISNTNQWLAVRRGYY